jgi:phage baseplate assembly protein W
MLSFDNVGYKVYETKNLTNPTISETPIGILTPLTIGSDEETFFKTTTDIKEVVKDNLKNLLLTNHGERLGRYFFGANLKELVLDYTSVNDFDEEARSRIKTAVRDYMPYVELKGYSSKASRNAYDSVTKVEILINFTVPKLEINNAFIKIELFVT